MLIAATRWILFCQLCPWFTSRQKYGPVRYEGGDREKCATSMCLSSLCRIACQFLRGGYAYQRGIGSGGHIPLS